MTEGSALIEGTAAATEFVAERAHVRGSGASTAWTSACPEAAEGGRGWRAG